MTWQEVGAAPSTEYAASCWIATWADGVDAQPFGTTPTDAAGIRIIQYDNTGSVVSDTRVADVTAQTEGMVQVCGSFTTTATTKRVRYCLDTLISETYVAYDKGTYVYYDDCVLDGPTLPATISGTVTGDGSPLSGATVADSTQSKSATTDASGAYTLTDMAAGTDETVRASKDGYYAQRKKRSWATGDNVALDFDLAAVGDNLLTNAGFDDVWNNGWHTEKYGADVWVINESYSSQYPYPVHYDSGEEALALFTPLDGLGRQAWVYQVIPVQANSDYTAKCRFFAGEGGGTLPASHWGTPGDGFDAALYVQEYDMSGEPVGVEHTADAAETKAWETLELSFQSDEKTRFVRVGATAKLGYSYNANLERAVFDSFEFNGAGGDPLPSFFGLVLSDGAPVPGAGVECVGTPYHTVTDANGCYELAVPAGTYNLRAGKTGAYYNQRKWGVATGNAVVFDLMPENLLANPQFDDQDLYRNGIAMEPGWTLESDGYGAQAQIVAGGSGEWIQVPLGPHSGAHAMRFRTLGAGNTSACWVHQDVSARPNESYSAKMWACGYGIGWALGQGDSLSLVVEEYDSGGSLISADHTVSVPFDESNIDTWIEVDLPSFTTQSQTATLRFKLDCVLVGGSGAYIEDCVLAGPAGPNPLQGAVKDESGATLLSGATVEAINDSAIPATTLSTVTGSTGQYSFWALQFSDYFTVRASRPGYYPQRKNCWTDVPQTVEFQLVPSAGNLLMNAGMDDGWNSGGWVDASETSNTYYIEECYTSSWGGWVFYHSGVHAASLVAEVGGSGYWYQQVPVRPSTEYTASGWFMPGTDVRYAHQWGWLEDEQKACLYVEEFDASGTAIEGTKQLVDFAEEADDLGNFVWDQKSAVFTTTAQTAFVRVGGYANLVDQYAKCLSRAVFDDFALMGPAPIVSLADAKSKPDGSLVSLSGQVVTANFSGYFYIEEPDRSSGIKVTGAAIVGTTVSVSGPITTVDGERVIEAGDATAIGAATVDPLGLTGVTAANDAKTVGLFVRAWGRVVEVGSGWFKMSDGSSALKVYGVAADGQYVAVTGALGAELSGADTITVLRATAIDPVDED